MGRFVWLVMTVLWLVPAMAQEIGPAAMPEKKENEPAKKESAEKTTTEKERTAALEPMVVTATRSDAAQRDIPADVRSFGEERIHRPGVKSAPAALSDSPGVKLNPRQEAAIFSDIEVRGLAGNSTSGGNVLVLLDGIPQRRLSFGGPYLGAQPFDAIVRMELVKGPMSSLYGRNALAGALQLFSDPGSDTLHWQSGAMYEYPSNTVHVMIKESGPLGTTPLGGSSLSTGSVTGGFTYAGGWQPRNEQTRGDLYLNEQLRLSDKDTIAITGGFAKVKEEAVAPVFIDKEGKRLPGIDRDENLAVPGQNWLGLTEYRIAGTYTRDWVKELKSVLRFSYWHGDTFWATGRPDDQPATGTVISRSASDRNYTENALFSEFELSGNYRLAEWLTGAATVAASYEYLTYFSDISNITTEESLTNTGSYNAGIPLDLSTDEDPGRSEWRYGDWTHLKTYEHDTGVMARKQFTLFDRVFVHGGFRFDWYSRVQRTPDSYDRMQRDDWAISPWTGLNVAALRGDRFSLNFYGNWGRGFSPIFRNVGSTQFADVSPETSEGFDAGLKTRLFGRMIEGNVAFYQLERRDIVGNDPTTKLPTNTGDWRIRGIETDWKVRPLKWMALSAGYAWRDNEITRYTIDPTLKGKHIPVIAPHMFVCGIEANSSFGLGGGTQVRYVAEAPGDEAHSFVLPEYVLWDAWISYDWKETFRVALFGKNLLDSEYFSAVFNGVKIGSAFEGLPLSVGVQVEAKI